LPSARPLKILTFYPAFAYLGVARNAWIISENKQKYLKYIYFSAVIINISLNFIFIPILGTTGAAIATLITQICTSLLLPYLLKPLRKNSQMIIDAIFFVKSK
jgi:Na+-driven multidrug efflux pump